VSDAPRQLDAPSTSDRLWRRVLGGPLGPLAALVLVFSLFALLDAVYSTGHFATMRNVRVILTGRATVAVAALGMTVIIIAGGIDLSAGTALAMCATVTAVMIRDGWSIPAALAATLGCGSLCGLLNGILISRLRVVPFIVTLGTMSIYLGFGNWLADETTVSPNRALIPDWLENFTTSGGEDYVWGFVPNLPVGVFVALNLAAAVGVVLKYTVFGRHVYALGSSEATARLCGVNVPWTKTAVYTLGGLLFGAAGIYYFSKLKNGDPTSGIGMELDVIAAVVIGGGSLAGGRGSIIGSLCGAAIMAIIRSGCDQLEVPNPYQHMIIGGIIIAAVAIDQFRQDRLVG